MTAIAKIVFVWLLIATGVGLIAALTIGHGDHGSAAFVVLAWYLALAGAGIHVLVRFAEGTSGLEGDFIRWSHRANRSPRRPQPVRPSRAESRHP